MLMKVTSFSIKKILKNKCPVKKSAGIYFYQIQLIITERKTQAYIYKPDRSVFRISIIRRTQVKRRAYHVPGTE